MFVNIYLRWSVIVYKIHMHCVQARLSVQIKFVRKCVQTSNCKQYLQFQLALAWLNFFSGTIHVQYLPIALGVNVYVKVCTHQLIVVQTPKSLYRDLKDQINIYSLLSTSQRVSITQFRYIFLRPSLWRV